MDESGRKQFDNYFKKLIREPLKSEVNKKEKVIKLEKSITIPEFAGVTVFDFDFDPENLRWR